MMRSSQLIRRNLTHYWQTNLVVILGVAIAVAVLAGALLVGDSVRNSLRSLFLQRVGNTDLVVSGTTFFREQLSSDLEKQRQFFNAGFINACPIIAIEGSVTNERNQSLASGVRVYGVDERFWEFHGSETRTLTGRDVSISESLANEIGSGAGDGLLLTVQKPSQIPIESLHSRKEDLGRVLRVTAREIVTTEKLGEFSLQPQQSGTRAIFVPLRELQAELEQPERVNVILIANVTKTDDPKANADKVSALGKMLRETASLDDYGIQVRELGQQVGLSVETESRILSDPLAETATKAANDLSFRTVPILSYLANSISVVDKSRSIPYSLVTGVGDETFKQLSGENGNVRNQQAHPLVLNEWAARDLGVTKGQLVSLDYYVWQENGELKTRDAEFEVVNVVPIKDLAADRDLVPEYPGITTSDNLSDWDPPFPVNLSLVRKQDEDYWDQYRTTPKAFIPLSVAQDLWRTRFGGLTSMRLVTPGESGAREEEGPEAESASVPIYRERLRSLLQPEAMGITVVPVRQQGLEASRGATDFGEYFLYFSFFLVISALLLTAVFFKLGVEQRLREIGLLYAIGFQARLVRNLFLAEGLVLSVLGSLLGVAGAIVYGQLMMTGLSTWWVQAVGTTMLKLHVNPVSLLIGGVGGIVSALLFVIITLRRLSRASTRSLLTGAALQDRESTTGAHKLVTTLRVAHVLALLGLLLLVAVPLGILEAVGGFFGGGLLLLTALLCYQSVWLRRRTGKLSGNGWLALVRLGFRNASYRPSRSVLCIALIAAAAFIIVSVEAFRRPGGEASAARNSGSGGFPLLAESLVPLVKDPNTVEGREILNLDNPGPADLSKVRFTPFRLRPGDDASCLNLYQPRNPRIIAPRDEFVQSNRFSFSSTVPSESQEKENPWLLLNRQFADGAVPVIADANSMTYVLHLKPGEDLVLSNGGSPIRLRMVAALSDSIFQSELIMSEANFLRLFPDRSGYRFFLIDAPAETASALEDRLSDFGFDVVTTSKRLSDFHQVENTYLSTFQMLGGLGLVLGTLGLSAVLLRNVFEQRRELALLSAIGYNSKHFTFIVIAENAFLVGCGIATGVGCALLAIAPAVLERGARFDNRSLVLLLFAVLLSGFIASLIATLAVLRAPVIPALRTE
jgi:ABC-type antimicrobial peptide transport system permease subunit